MADVQLTKMTKRFGAVAACYDVDLRHRRMASS